MLSNHNILVIGGDERYVEVIQQLKSNGVKIQVCGFEKLPQQMDVLHTTLENVDFRKLDAILLPVSGTNEQGKIELAPFSKNDLLLTEQMIKQTPEHCTIYTGISGAFLDWLAERTGRTLVRLFKRDDMAILNSIPTAEGTLEIAMRETDTMIHGSNVLVLGFGRVGVTVAHLFQNVGAHVGVSARKASDLARCTEMRMSPVKFEDLFNEVDSYDLIINTIPHQVIDSQILAFINSSTLIIDLASAPGGVDFKKAQEKGIKAIHALGLPGKVAPKSAGRLISDVFIDLLKP